VLIVRNARDQHWQEFLLCTVYEILNESRYAQFAILLYEDKQL